MQEKSQEEEEEEEESKGRRLQALKKQCLHGLLKLHLLKCSFRGIAIRAATQMKLSILVLC